MNNFSQYLVPVTVGVMVAGLSTYSLIAAGSRNSSVIQTQTTPITTQPSPQTPVTPNPVNTITNPTNPTPINTITLNIYRVDSQCESLIPEKVSVPATTPVNAAVGKVLEQANSADFDLAGYRVNLNPNTRVATIDFRLSPDSQRQFVSLSMCEQFALLGSLRKTLTDNSQLKIKEVRFTEQGREIIL